MTKAHKESTAVAVPEVQKQNLPSVVGEDFSIDDLAADSGSGLQNVTATDLATPILYVLQSNSPPCKRSDGKYIEGAIEGMIFNNVTSKVYGGEDGVNVIPCFFEKVYIEWKPNRGGFVAVHPENTDLKDKVTMVQDKDGKVIPTLPNGNSLIETNQHYVLVLDNDGSFEPAVIPMTSTALKASRTWNSLQKKVILKDSKGRLFTPASYYSTYKLSTKARTKDQYSWFSWNVEQAGPTPSRALYDAAKSFEQAVSSGKVKVKIEETTAEVEPSMSDDNSIPF